MTHKLVRVICTDASLLGPLKKIYPHAAYEACEARLVHSRFAEADLILLDDATALSLEEKSEAVMRPSLVVTAKDGDSIPKSYAKGIVDDLLVLPLRALDVDRMFRMHEFIEMLRKAEQASLAIPDLARKLQEDVHIAQKIQRRLIREKFSPIGGLSIKSKYWCGLKAGGDYFDVFEFPDGVHVGMILSDSSTYSLSTTLITSLMQFSLQVSQGDVENPSLIVSALLGKLKEGFKEKDRLSLFYGVLNRKTYELKFVEAGSVFAVQRSEEGEVLWNAKGETPAFSLSNFEVPEARTIALSPGDRFILVSDGWAESVGQSTSSFLEHFVLADRDPQDLLNDMAFSLRKSVEKDLDEEEKARAEFPMPPQDCSVLIFDLAKNVLRLAR